jgi:hypothetical protein
MAQDTHELVVRKNIQLPDILTLHVDRAGVTQDIDQSCFIDLYIHPLGSQTDIPEQIAQFACGVGEHPKLLKRKLVKRKYSPIDAHMGFSFTPQK